MPFIFICSVVCLIIKLFFFFYMYVLKVLVGKVTCVILRICAQDFMLKKTLAFGLASNAASKLFDQAPPVLRIAL